VVKLANHPANHFKKIKMAGDRVYPAKAEAFINYNKVAGKKSFPTLAKKYRYKKQTSP